MKYFILITLSLIGSLSLAAPPRLCIVNFERPLAPQTRLLDRLFKGKADVRIYHNARPTDFAKCIEEGAEEILILAHALLTSDNRRGEKPANLGFFLDIQGQAREKIIQDWLGHIDTEIKKLAPFGKNHSDPGIQKQYRRLIHQQLRLKRFPKTAPFFVVRPILPQAFRVAQRAAQAQKESPSGLRLRKIRLLSCVPHQVLAQYDELRALIADHNVELDIAPINTFWSFIKGVDVASPDIKWLKESL